MTLDPVPNRKLSTLGAVTYLTTKLNISVEDALSRLQCPCLKKMPRSFRNAINRQRQQSSEQSSLKLTDVPRLTNIRLNGPASKKDIGQIIAFVGQNESFDVTYRVTNKADVSFGGGRAWSGFVTTSGKERKLVFVPGTKDSEPVHINLSRIVELSLKSA
jgi:hypothetical protein